jgi:lipopolysaccharide transport protein LptA
MAHSCRSLAWLLGCNLAAPALALAAPPAPQPISVDARSSEVDYKTNTVVFTQVVISQGATRVQAEHAHATGLDFANSRWIFEGNVRIEAQEQGTLRSDVAVVEFRDNHIARATITGKPAAFEQQRADSDKVARGHADEIVYDVDAGTVRLTTDAWLSNGQNEISGPLLVYNMREQRVEAATAPGTGEHIHITISGHDVAKPDAGKASSPQP